jgi:hypothetical protein
MKNLVKMIRGAATKPKRLKTQKKAARAKAKK